MLNSTVLDVALGLVFCWGTVALLASSVYEAIASLLKLRARQLLTGVKELLNDKDFTGLALGVYRNALANPRTPGPAADQSQVVISKPSYIDPMHFAQALLEAIQGGPDAAGVLKSKIDGMADKQLQAMLLGMYARAADMNDVQKELASWFSAGMERVSGVYKRKAQLFTFLIALLVAGLLNIDTFHLCGALWAHPADVTRLSAPGGTTDQALQALKQLPVGWTAKPVLSLLGFCGWLATACSALFGAPFWFGLLQRLVNLRGSGPKPSGASA
jgi:hypothetical protein